MSNFSLLFLSLNSLMVRKGLLLFLALMLPVSIFLFLHYFGKNEFEVPVLFQTADELPTDCNIEHRFPYKVKSAEVDVTGGCVVLFSSGLSGKMFDDTMFELSRLQDEFGKRAPRVIVLKKTGDHLPSVKNEIALNSAKYTNEQRCVFLAGTNLLVLVDAESHIRGLYADTSLKEIDRLILELKIIFKQY